MLDSDIINEQGKIHGHNGSPLHTDSTEEPTPQGPRHKGFKFPEPPHEADADTKPAAKTPKPA